MAGISLYVFSTKAHFLTKHYPLRPPSSASPQSQLAALSQLSMPTSAPGLESSFDEQYLNSVSSGAAKLYQTVAI